MSGATKGIGKVRKKPYLLPRGGGLRLPELADEEEETDLERDRERETDLDGLERDLELERDEDPDTEGERRLRLGFAMGDNRAKSRRTSETLLINPSR